MELASLYFNYSVELKGFDYISYSFIITPDEKRQETFSSMKMYTSEGLEFLLDQLYNGAEKKKSGDITAYEINTTYEYRKNYLFLFSPLASALRLLIFRAKPEKIDANLKCSAKMEEDKVRYFNIELSDHSDNSKKLEVFDAIMKIPNLSISKHAQSSIAKINYLRQNQLSIDEYLEHALQPSRE